IRDKLDWSSDVCSSDLGEKQPREYLDEDTAATVTVVGEPLVFAYAIPALAANQRDYVTLAAAAVNRNGKVSYVLIAYFWSTIDRSEERRVGKERRARR